MPNSETLPAGPRGWRRWAFVAASVLAHAGLVAALVLTTEGETMEAQAPQNEEKVTYVDIASVAPPPPAAPSPQATTPEPRQATPQPRRARPRPEPRQATPQPQTPPRSTDIVEPVDSLPEEPLGAEPTPEQVPEPVVEPTPSVAPAVQPGVEPGGQEGGEPGGKTGGVVGGKGDAVPEGGGTFVAAVVDRKAELKNRSDLPRIMERLYPDAMRAAGTKGRVVVQFVVDTNGRVDMGTVKIISSTNKAFEEATRRALDRFRFTPAKMGERSVRMLTQLPVVWTIER